MPSTVTETVSPSCIGPTPAGVPVSITSPGSSVIASLTYATISATSCIMSRGAAVLLELVVDACRSDARSGGSSSVSIHGPSGQNVSKPLARAHCPSACLQVAGGDVVGAGVAEDHLVHALAGTSRHSRPMTTASSPS